MHRDSVEDVLRSLDRRVGRIEQVLPTLATKDEIRNLATKDEIRNLATKDEIRNLATKDEIRNLATKDEIRNLATKDEIRNLATKDEIRNLATRDELSRFATKEDMLAEGARTRAHFDAVAERLESQILVLAEGLTSLDRRFEEFRTETRANFATVDRRLLRLEARAAREDVS